MGKRLIRRGLQRLRADSPEEYAAAAGNQFSKLRTGAEEDEATDLHDTESFNRYEYQDDEEGGLRVNDSVATQADRLGYVGAADI